MHVIRTDASLREILCQIFCHPFRQCCHEDALFSLHTFPNLADEMVDLVFHRMDANLRIDEACRADQLLGNLRAVFDFIIPRCRRDKDNLVDMHLNLFKPKRPVIQRRWEPKPVVNKCLLSRPVTAIHPAQLRDSHVRFVHKKEEIVWEVVEETVRRFTRLQPGEMPRVVFNA